MGLRLRINLVIAAVGLPLLLVGGLILDRASAAAARAASARETALLTHFAETAATYVTDKVAPLATNGRQPDLVFVPAASPFYAVQTEANLLERKLPGVTLRRVAVDPIGDDDRPSAWEQGILNQFRTSHDPRPVIAERPGSDGERLVLATPLLYSQGICATCYPSRADAPPGVLDVFGNDRGFDFHPGEVVGMTVASVPIRDTSALVPIATLVAFALLLWAAFNVALQVFVLRPLGLVASIAEQVSLGKENIAEFETARPDEIGAVTRAFNRLRRSMESAIRLIEP